MRGQSKQAGGWKVGLVVSSVWAAMLPDNAFAAGTLGGDVTSAYSALQQLTTWLMYLTPVAAVLGVAYVSFLHSFTENEGEAFAKRKWRTRILVSAVVVFAASAIVNFVTGIVK